MTAIAGLMILVRWMPSKGKHSAAAVLDEWSEGPGLSILAHVGLLVGVQRLHLGLPHLGGVIHDVLSGLPRRSADRAAGARRACPRLPGRTDVGVERGAHAERLPAAVVETTRDRRSRSRAARSSRGASAGRATRRKAVIMLDDARQRAPDPADPDQPARRARRSSGIDMWVIPHVQPRRLARHTRKNAHGVDLNRNYPYRWARPRRQLRVRPAARPPSPRPGR